MACRGELLTEGEARGLYLDRLGEDDLAAIVALHKAALRTAPVAGLVKPDTDDFFREHLGFRGRIWGLFDEKGAMMAYAVLGLPRPGGYNLGPDAGLAEKDWPEVAHLAGATVDHACRGRRIQYFLTRFRMEQALGLGRRHVVSTVDPRNYASWRSLMKCGLHISGLVRKYGGLARFVLYRDMAADMVAAQPRPAGQERLVAAEDLDGIARLLGDGWTGTGWHQDDAGQMRVRFSRF